MEEIDGRWKEIRKNNTAALRCDETYEDQLTTNYLNHKSAYARAANTGKGILLTCLGLGTPVATGVAVRVGWISGDKISLTIARVGSGVLGGITFLASLTYCRNLANGAAQSEIDVADLAKEHADNVGLRRRDTCRRNTNYERVIRRYIAWRGSLPSGGPRRPSNYRQSIYDGLKAQARADHRKCLEQFQDGNCEVN